MSAQRRALIAIVTVAVVSLLATACGSGGGGDGDQVTLRIWDYSAEQVQFHEDVAARFTEEHPDIRIEWRSITQDEYNNTLPLAFQSRQAPDIFYWSDGGPLAMNRMLAQDWIQPLNPGGGPLPPDVQARWPEGSFIDGINISEGDTYGFPFSETLYWGPGYMYMNNKVFADAGLDPANPPRTWSELEAACARVVSTTEAECIAAPTKGSQLQRPWFALAGGSMTDMFFDYRAGRFALDDPKLLETFGFLQRLGDEGYLAPGTNDQNFSRQQFAADQAAIYFDGTWMPSVWASQGFTSDRFSVAAHPNPDGGATGALARRQEGNKYWISSQTEHHDAAWTFLEWMTRPDGYFVQQYYKGGFGTLAFADSESLVTDPALRQIMDVARQPGFRVQVPEPVLKCPDLARSDAYLDAISTRPNAEWEIMNQALVDGTPLASAATALVAERQQILESTLAEEAASGLKVSMDCYTFSDWDHTSDYGLENYAR